MGLSRPVSPNPEDARTVAEWLIEARNPVIITGHSGRNPESVEALVRLAELLAVPVMDCSRTNRMNFPASHPLYGTGPHPQEADVILVCEAVVPFNPPREWPQEDTKIAWVDPDPVQSRYKTMEFDADLWIPAPTAAAAHAIHEAATARLSKSDLSRIAERRARLMDRKRELTRQTEERLQKTGQRNPINPAWVGYQLGQVLAPDAIIVNDGTLRIYPGRDVAGTYLKSGGSAGGYGSGAAFGAKVARPERDVVLTTGDGYFMFGSPLVALWAAAHHKAPFLTVVMVNRSYSTGTQTLARQYPDGAAVTAGDYTGGLFDPAPDFAKLAEAANGYGENVSDPAAVRPALERALKHVRDGTPAVVAVMLPTIPEEMAMGGELRGE
jgi:acetolactate synthase-1/2/3 large subunit